MTCWPQATIAANSRIGCCALPSQLDVGVAEPEIARGRGVGSQAVGAADPFVGGERDSLADPAVEVRSLHGPVEVEVAAQQRTGVGHGAGLTTASGELVEQLLGLAVGVGECDGFDARHVHATPNGCEAA